MKSDSVIRMAEFNIAVRGFGYVQRFYICPDCYDVLRPHIISSVKVGSERVSCEACTKIKKKEGQN